MLLFLKENLLVKVYYKGEGAGPGPTSSSLLSDLLSILKGNVKKPFGIPGNKRKSIKML